MKKPQPAHGDPLNKRELSQREKEIVELSIQGLTNEAIAVKLKVSPGTIYTYWARIRLKLGGVARTDSIAKYVEAKVLKSANGHGKGNQKLDVVLFEAAMTMLRISTEESKATAWSVDPNHVIQLISNEQPSPTHFGVDWKVGMTIEEVFGDGAASEAHRKAFEGHESKQRLPEKYERMILRVVPVKIEGEVAGVAGVLYRDEQSLD